MFYLWHIFLELYVFSFWVWYIILTVASTFCLLELMECNLCVSLSMYVQFMQVCFQRWIWLIGMGDTLYVSTVLVCICEVVQSSGNSILTFDSSVMPPESCKWIWNYSMSQNRTRSKTYLWLSKTCTIKKHVELEILCHAVLTSVPVGGEHLASSLATLPLEKMVLCALYKWLVP